MVFICLLSYSSLAIEVTPRLVNVQQDICFQLSLMPWHRELYLWGLHSHWVLSYSETRLHSCRNRWNHNARRLCHSRWEYRLSVPRDESHRHRWYVIRLWKRSANAKCNHASFENKILCKTELLLDRQHLTLLVEEHVRSLSFSIGKCHLVGLDTLLVLHIGGLDGLSLVALGYGILDSLRKQVGFDSLEFIFGGYRNLSLRCDYSVGIRGIEAEGCEKSSSDKYFFHFRNVFN